MNIYCQHLNLASILQVVFVSFFGAMYYFNFWQNSSEPLESEIETSTAVQPTGTLAGALQPIGKDSVWYLEKRKPWIFWGVVVVVVIVKAPINMARSLIAQNFLKNGWLEDTKTPFLLGLGLFSHRRTVRLPRGKWPKNKWVNGVEITLLNLYIPRHPGEYLLR